MYINCINNCLDVVNATEVSTIINIVCSIVIYYSTDNNLDIRKYKYVKEIARAL